MPSSWPIYHIGKLTDPVTGAIVRGQAAGFTQTGQSAGFPKELEPACKPVVVGAADRTRWTTYHWLGKPSALLLRPVAVGGRWFLQAVRLRVRGEGAGGKSGPNFHQTAFLVLPVADLWDPLDLFGLPAAAQVEEFAERQLALPAPRVEGGDRGLSPGWFDDDARRMLAAVVSGHGVSVHDLKTPPDEFFEEALRCVACLPQAVRWRVPIGAGFLEPPADAGIYHGQGVGGKVRKIDGVWKQSPGVDLSAGDEYVRWIAPLADQVSSVGDLMRRIDALFRGTALDAWNGIPDDAAPVPWADAVGYMLEARELAELRIEFGLDEPDPHATAAAGHHAHTHAASRPGPPPDRARVRRTLDGFRWSCRQALEMLLHVVTLGYRGRSAGREPSRSRTRDPGENPDESRAGVALAVLCDLAAADAWAEVWRAAAGGDTDAARTARTVGGLLGVVPLDLARVSLADAVVPAEHVDAAAGRVRAALDGSPRYDEDLETLLAAAAGEAAPPVLVRWHDAAGPDLFWHGLKRSLSGNARSRFSANAGFGPAVWGAMDGYAPDTRTWADLCRSVNSPTAALTAGLLAHQLAERGMATEACLLGAAAERLEPSVAGPVLAALRGRGGWRREDPSGAANLLAAEIVAGGGAALLLLPLVMNCDELPRTDRHVITTEVRPKLSPVFMTVVFGEFLAPTAAGTLSAAELAVLPDVVRRDPYRLNRLSGLLCYPPVGLPWGDVVRAVAAGGWPGPSLACPAAELAAAVWAGMELAALPDLSVEDAGRVSEALAESPDWAKPARLRQELRISAANLRAFAAVSGPGLQRHWTYQYDERFFPDILKECAAGPVAARFWAETFGTANFTGREVCRLIAARPGAVPFPSFSEENILQTVDRDVLLYYLPAFQRWGDRLTRRVERAVREGDLPGPEQVLAVADLALARRSSEVFGAVVERVVGRCQLRHLRVRPDEWDELAARLGKDAEGAFEYRVAKRWRDALSDAASIR